MVEAGILMTGGSPWTVEIPHFGSGTLWRLSYVLLCPVVQTKHV